MSRSSRELAVAQTLPATGREQNDPRLLQFYNGFCVQSDRSATDARRAGWPRIDVWTRALAAAITHSLSNTSADIEPVDVKRGTKISARL